MGAVQWRDRQHTGVGLKLARPGLLPKVHGQREVCALLSIPAGQQGGGAREKRGRQAAYLTGSLAHLSLCASRAQNFKKDEK